jgi:hypothetical protein
MIQDREQLSAFSLQLSAFSCRDEGIIDFAVSFGGRFPGAGAVLTDAASAPLHKLKAES